MHGSVRPASFPWEPGGRSGLAVLATLLATTLAACSGDGRSSGERRAVPEPGSDAASLVLPARYTMEQTFVALDSGGPRLHLHFRQRTSATDLHRRYRGWSLARDGWEPLLRVTDSLPTPRAGWRLLPAPGLRVVIGEEGSVTALALGEPGSGPRLEAAPAVLSWSGPTGSEESLRPARLTRADTAWDGFLLTRRRAIPLDDPPAAGGASHLLVVDAAGRAVVVLPGAPSPAAGGLDTLAAVHAWFGGDERSWPDVRFSRVPGGANGAGGAEGGDGSGGSPETFRIFLPRAGLDIRVSVTSPPAEDPVSDGASVRVLALRGRIEFRDLRRPATGVRVENLER